MSIFMTDGGFSSSRRASERRLSNMNGAGSSWLPLFLIQLDGYDAARGLEEMVDLAGPAAFSLPIEKLGTVSGMVAGETERSASELIGELCAHVGGEILPIRERSPAGVLHVQRS
jgi:hypothetical protein